MNDDRLNDYLDHIRQAATDARVFVEGMSYDDFINDKRTQHAVVMSLLIIGEAVIKIMNASPAFIASRPDIAWQPMRGMRNRIARGYFEINFEVVWDTVENALPELLAQLQ